VFWFGVLAEILKLLCSGFLTAAKLAIILGISNCIVTHISQKFELLCFGFGRDWAVVCLLATPQCRQ